MDDRNRTAAAGQDSGSQAITLLRDAVAVCRRHPRDPGATDLAIRAHRYLANFPVHFVTEYLVKGAEYPERHRVPVAQWPTWADGLATSERNVQDAASAWRQVQAAAREAAPEEFTADQPGTNLERVLRVLARRQEEPAPSVVAEYIAARTAYEDATRPLCSHGPARSLKHGDPVLLRYRAARAALDATATAADGPMTCATCGKAIRDDAMTGTACDCSQPMVEADGADALEAVQAIAEKLGVACTPEAIDEAIEELQDGARQLPAAVDTNAMRLLWLVIREAGAPGGVTISRHALHLADWSRAYMTTTEALDGSTVTYQAMTRGGA